jgi:hypothetical protein
MKRILFLSMILLAIATSVFAGDKKVKVTVNEADAKIFVGGKLMGTGEMTVLVPAYSCVTVKVEKAGFLTGTVEFCNKPKFAPPPKSYQFKLDRDDAYDASEASDMANIDIEIKTNKTEAEAWKLISQIVTSYFDVIEVTDKETGYLRTSWVTKNFTQNTIRTRIIVKLGSDNPLTYKIKLVSEQSGQPQTSVKNDEIFKEWDRILRKYREVIHEVQSRLAS